MEEATAGKLKRTAVILLRLCMFALAGWLLYRTVSGNGTDFLAVCLNAPTPSLLLLAFLLYGAAQFAGARRWQTLLKAVQLPIGFWSALRLTLVGNFFSLALPGAVTGDVVKVAYATRIHPGRAVELTLVDLMDRLVGVAGLVCAAALATIPGYINGAFAWETGQAPLFTRVVGRFAWPALRWLALLYILYRMRHLLMRLSFLQRAVAAVGRRLPRLVKAPLLRLNAALNLYDRRQGALWKALGLSVVIHLFLLSGVNCAIGCAIRPWHFSNDRSFSDYALVTQVSNATGLVAITPGGIGLRDMAAADLYNNYLNTYRANEQLYNAAIPLINSLVIVLWGLVGALLYGLGKPLLSKQSPTSNIETSV